MNVTVISWCRLQIVLVTIRLSIPLIGFSLSLVPYICLEVGIVKYLRTCPLKWCWNFPPNTTGSILRLQCSMDLFIRGKLKKFKFSIRPLVDLRRSHLPVKKKSAITLAQRWYASSLTWRYTLSWHSLSCKGLVAAKTVSFQFKSERKFEIKIQQFSEDKISMGKFDQAGICKAAGYKRNETDSSQFYRY